MSSLPSVCNVVAVTVPSMVGLKLSGRPACAQAVPRKKDRRYEPHQDGKKGGETAADDGRDGEPGKEHKARKTAGCADVNEKAAPFFTNVNCL